jgi:Mn-dependent DtxR family transcriptional regulator
MLVLSSLFGAVSALAGFLLAFALNIPTGPAMVIVATVLFAGALLFSPEYGVVGGWLKARETRRHVVEEDVLKTLAKFGGALPFETLGDKLAPTPPRAIRAALAVLTRAQLVTEAAGSARLTPTGIERGTMLVRSHRIWETWLASEHITAESLHGEAERFEHLHDMADELSKELGDPKIDPHGVPIPPRRT